MINNPCIGLEYYILLLFLCKVGYSRVVEPVIKKYPPYLSPLSCYSTVQKWTRSLCALYVVFQAMNLNVKAR